MAYNPGIAFDPSPIMQGALAGANFMQRGAEVAGSAIGRGISNLGEGIGEGIQKYQLTKEKLDMMDAAVTGIGQRGMVPLSAEDLTKFRQSSMGAKQTMVTDWLAQESMEQKGRAAIQAHQFKLAEANARRFDPSTARAVPLPGGVGTIVMDANGNSPDTGKVFKSDKAGGPDFDINSAQVVDAGDLGKVLKDSQGRLMDPKFLVQQGNPKFDINSAEVRELPGVGRVLADAKGNVLDPSKVIQPKEGEKAPKKTEADISFDTNVATALQGLDELDAVVAKPWHGNWENRWGNSETISKLKALPYQLAIQYAKIVDPASVAREGEVVAAQKYMIPMGFWTTNEVTRAAIKHMRKTIHEYQSNRAAAQGKATPTLTENEADVLEVPKGSRFILNGKIYRKK